LPPLYFFDEIADSIVIEDDVGIELPDLNAARLDAVKSAREQIAGSAKAGFDSLYWQLLVREERRKMIFKLPFRETSTRR
jgi:hypothetical protein